MHAVVNRIQLREPLGDDEDALERTRAGLGNSWMREHVIPHAAGPPERTLAEAVVSYERPVAG